MGRFTSKQLNAARKAELYDYILAKHADVIKRKGSTLVLKNESYVKIRKGYSGFRDYQSGESGNSIDFLIRYLDYSFEEAVVALLNI